MLFCRKPRFASCMVGDAIWVATRLGNSGLGSHLSSPEPILAHGEEAFAQPLTEAFHVAGQILTLSCDEKHLLSVLL